MKHDSFKTYLHWGLTAFGVVALSILFFFSLFKVGALVHFSKRCWAFQCRLCTGWPWLIC